MRQENFEYAQLVAQIAITDAEILFHKEVLFWLDIESVYILSGTREMLEEADLLHCVILKMINGG